jgi:hypothetical protein
VTTAAKRKGFDTGRIRPPSASAIGTRTPPPLGGVRYGSSGVLSSDVREHTRRPCFGGAAVFAGESRNARGAARRAAPIAAFGPSVAWRSRRRDADRRLLGRLSLNRTVRLETRRFARVSLPKATGNKQPAPLTAEAFGFFLAPSRGACPLPPRRPRRDLSRNVITTETELHDERT